MIKNLMPNLSNIYKRMSTKPNPILVGCEDVVDYHVDI